MIGLVTDSNSQMPPELAKRLGVEIVPLTVTVDGVAHLEGVDLGADDFYALFATATPVVSTSQPSAGQFARAYRAVAARGAEAILSIHIGSSLSGTVNAARLAAETSPVPVRIVDSGTASFGVACCVSEAADALATGASTEDAAQLAERTGRGMGNVWVVGALDLARSGGRLREGQDGTEAGIPVLTTVDGAMEVSGRADDVEGAAEAMASAVRSGGSALRVGVGLADLAATTLRDALERRLAASPEVGEVVRYRIGPSVGAHTGPGTVGAMFYRPGGRGSARGAGVPPTAG